MSGANDKYEIQAAFKNSVKRKPNTSGNLNWYEESGEIHQRVDAASFWLDSEYIPTTAPNIKVGEKFSVELGTVTVDILERVKVELEKVKSSRSSFSNEKLINSIDIAFGYGYGAVLRDANDDIISFGLKKWVIDSTSGVLTFIDGLPEGYNLPISVEIYRYIGRFGMDGLLTTDGANTLDDDYVPLEDKSIVPKDYVDSKVNQATDILYKLVPKTPPTFKDTDLEIATHHTSAGLANSTGDFVNVIYKDEQLVLLTQKFWNEDEKGYVSLRVRSIQNQTDTDLLINRVSMKDLTRGENTEGVPSDAPVIEPSQPKVEVIDYIKSNMALAENPLIDKKGIHNVHFMYWQYENSYAIAIRGDYKSEDNENIYSNLSTTPKDYSIYIVCNRWFSEKTFNRMRDDFYGMLRRCRYALDYYFEQFAMVNNINRGIHYDIMGFNEFFSILQYDLDKIDSSMEGSEGSEESSRESSMEDSTEESSDEESSLESSSEYDGPDIKPVIPPEWDEPDEPKEDEEEPPLDIDHPLYHDSFFKVLEIEDSYKDSFVASGFYKSLLLEIRLSALYNLFPATHSLDTPVYKVYLEYTYTSSNGVKTVYQSNPLFIGVDEKSPSGFIQDTVLAKVSTKNTYISGVPALVGGDTLNLKTYIGGIKSFVIDNMGTVDIDNGLYTYDITTKRPYVSNKDYRPLVKFDQDFEVPDNYYRESLPIYIEGRNIDNEINVRQSNIFKVRIDSVSDESKRYKSPSKSFRKGWDSETFDEFNPIESCVNNCELQMLNGLYQWPRGNYTGLGTTDNVMPSGPDYDSIGDGTRYVTFKFDLPDCNGFYFTLKDSEGIRYDASTFVIDNFIDFKCKVENKTNWLDMNLPYNGVLLPRDYEGSGCLVINRSDKDTRYATFGTETYSGTLIIVIGIGKDLNIKFSDLEVRPSL